MNSTDRCDRSHKSGPLSGAQKRKEQKAALECSLRGTSKLSSYFSLLPVTTQNVTKEEAEDHGDTTLENNDSTLTVPDSADTIEVESASKVQSEAGDNCENRGKLGHDYQVEEGLDNFPTDLGQLASPSS